jgi:hypothetical protein
MQSITVFVAAVLAVVGCATSPAPLAPPITSPSDEPRATLDPAITYVVTGPTIFGDDEQFEYRLVVRKSCSPEHCFDSAQLDWIVYTEYAPSSPVVRSAEITELRDSFAVVSESPKIVVQTHNRVTITILLTSTYTSEQAVLCLWPERTLHYAAEIRHSVTGGLTVGCS